MFKTKHYSSEGIVLARRNYSEADRILVVYSKHYGKISLLAKGVRKPKSRKRGSLEVFSRTKFTASRGRNLDILTEVELIDSYKHIRKDLRKASLAYFFVEVVNRLVQAEEKNYQFYIHFINYFQLIKTTSLLKRLKEYFIYDCLVLLGFWPKGKKMDYPDQVLEDITERKLSSARIGKKILS